MRFLIALIGLGAVLAANVLANPTPTNPLEDRVKQLETIIATLTRQVMLQEFYAESKSRTDGNSGIKSQRLHGEGEGAYSYCQVHNHQENVRTAGMGELGLVMNGVEFQTRHNDYRVRMPSTTTDQFHKLEDIPFPDVPPTVLAQPTVEEQIEEMKEYFRAFRDQNVTHRDYRPFFTPNLCYIEAAWTLDKNLVEPFESVRHSLNANSWLDLMEKLRYRFYVGDRDMFENLAFLPNAILNVSADGRPMYAQWNYRIACHPLKDDLPLSSLKLENELTHRFPYKLPMDKLRTRYAAKFVLKDEGKPKLGASLLDRLMEQIPGKDNYGAMLYDDAEEKIRYKLPFKNRTRINTGYYHRFFRTTKGGDGVMNVGRGFNDEFLFVAQTTQERIAPMTLRLCKNANDCKYWTRRYSYALPLEIIYFTPLHTWNPRNLQEDVKHKIIKLGGRNGKNTPEEAYNGTNPYLYYYKTPLEFYKRDDGKAFLDKDGQPHMMARSGIRVMTPYIKDVGSIRLRFPIMPRHGEGAPVWKELNALKEATMHMNRHRSMFIENPWPSNVTEYQLFYTNRNPPGRHTHSIYLTPEEVLELKEGGFLYVTTTKAKGHTHRLVIRFDKGRNRILNDRCDEQYWCWDGHDRWFTKIG